MTSMNGADDALCFVPLGGTGEIGMNLSLYGLDGKWLMVDFGISFGDETMPGIDIVMPDPTFIEDRKEDLVGLVLTHGHEDHFGAIPYLWQRLECPIHATPFTAAFLRRKLAETDFADRVKIVEIPLSGRFDLGPFGLEFITMTHSIPEPNALVIRTRHGVVVHSGDWKLDPQPLVGEPTDIDALQRVGRDGVLALVCDSTNALEPGRTGSEADVRVALTAAIAKEKNRVAVTCFSTNVARLHSVAEAAHANGRHCALIGRSLWRIHEAARETGYLNPPEPFVTEADAGFLPRDKIVMVCTGSQGEPRSALSRIARGDHPNIVLDRDDTVFFSAREIPGNEKAIIRVQNQLVESGVKLVTPDDAPIHVSGHPGQDDLTDLYQWLRPRISVPVHGEARHLRAHAQLARRCQVPEVAIPHDGAVIRLAPGPAETVGEVTSGRLARDGHRLIRLDSGAIRGRNQMTHNGAALATVVLDGHGRLAGSPQVALLGLEDEADLDDAQADVSDEVRDAVGRLSKPQRDDDEAVREAARRAVRKAIRSWHGKRPVTTVHIVRV